MKLTQECLVNNRKEWEEAGYALPQYDRIEMAEETARNPKWVHFGAGNIFRAFQANLMQTLLNDGEEKAGIIAVDGFDFEIILKNYRPHDNLSILVTLKADGSIEKTLIGSIGASLIMDREYAEDFEILESVFRNPSLQMVSFTITEKGYSLTDAKGETLPAVKADFLKGPAEASSYIGKIASLLYARYKNGQLPVSMVSMDNCSHNGDKLYAAVDAYAKAWAENGLAEKGFVSYIENPEKVAFPWTMIDKITPRPDASVEKLLEKDGLDLTPVETSRHTFIAPFVNAEESEYLVVEDLFPNGRPALEKAGVYFTDRETVNKVERMKVCTCLNPLHTSLAVFGCLLGYQKISDEMKDEDLFKLVNTIGYKEGLPVVTNPGILSPKEFIDTVVNVRIPNPFMPDTPQRIATDTSQKLAIRFGETIKAYQSSDELDVNDLKLIPLVQAAWIRYLMKLDDELNPMELSSDPLLEELEVYSSALKIGEETEETLRNKLEDLLRNKKIFGLDLVEAGLDKLVISYLCKMTAGKGAVRKTLQEAL
ncbi:MAG: mannitol dehydrogenase family protein [Erysipelotrichaceae bacterium]|nr:mannitol dehydrogenase family protein [Erysipelotrichaceae bacterium]